MTQRGWIVLVAILWALLSWRWYTCHIKGFCGNNTHSEQYDEQGKYPDNDRWQNALQGRALDLDHDGDMDVIVRSLEANGENRNGECNSYIRGNILPAPNHASNDSRDIRKLAAFLNATEETDLLLDDVYDEDDIIAVRNFQKKYEQAILAPWNITEPTGRVMQTTRTHINQLYCAQQ